MATEDNTEVLVCGLVNAAAVVFGSLASMVLWDCFIFQPSRKKFLGEYDRSGVDVEGWIVDSMTTRIRAPFQKTFFLVRLRYAYRQARQGKMELLYTKQHIRAVFDKDAVAEITSAPFMIKVLPKYKKSGFPKIWVDQRNHSDQNFRIVFPCRICLGFFYLLASSWAVAVEGLVDHGNSLTVSIPVWITAFLGYSVIGLLCSCCQWYDFKHGMLEAVVTDDTPLPGQLLTVGEALSEANQQCTRALCCRTGGSSKNTVEDTDEIESHPPQDEAKVFSKPRWIFMDGLRIRLQKRERGDIGGEDDEEDDFIKPLLVL